MNLTDLTPRQHQIADLIIRGELAKSIAFRLNLAEETVKTYSHYMYERTGCVNRADFTAQYTMALLEQAVFNGGESAFWELMGKYRRAGRSA